MKAALLKRFFRAIHSGSDSELESLCESVIQSERELGHGRVAEDLEEIVSKAKLRRPSSPDTKSLTQLPTTRKGDAPLIVQVEHEDLRHHIVLPSLVERRFQRIEKEFSARSRLANFGLQPRRRILLYGPPGCGKSLGAERLAWSTGLPLFKVRFDTLLSSYFGETHSNLRRVFDVAKETPCALFLDECDTLARSRLERNDVGEATRITNALLELLESYQGDGLVIAATNLDSSLDPALIRRFDEVLKIPLPTTNEIQRILKTTLEALKVDRAIKWTQLAGQMDGMSCSEVTQIGRNAAKHAVMEGRKKVQEADLKFALDEIHERHHQKS